MHDRASQPRENDAARLEAALGELYVDLILWQGMRSRLAAGDALRPLMDYRIAAISAVVGGPQQ